jgi:hypothetical protein
MMPTPFSRLTLIMSTVAVASLAVLGYFTQVVHAASLRGELTRAHQRATGEFLQPSALALVNGRLVAATATEAVAKPGHIAATRVGNMMVSSSLVLAQTH